MALQADDAQLWRVETRADERECVCVHWGRENFGDFSWGVVVILVAGWGEKGNFGVTFRVGRPTTTTSLTVTACHHLPHFFTLTHLTILPITIITDDDQHHRRHLSSSSGATQVVR